jgi:hypothetical protein
MKLIFLLLLSGVFATSSFVYAQDEASELEELESELDSIESNEGEEVSESPDFTEQQESPEDLGTLETNDVEQELENVLEDGEENLVDDAPATAPGAEEESIEGVADKEPIVSPTPGESEVQENLAAPTEPIEIPMDDTLDPPPPEEFAAPEDSQDSPIAIPGTENENAEIASQAPEMLTPLPDEPNAGKERSIFNAYQYIKNYSKLDEAWPQASQGREAESYGVQAGDSLWDISVTLFGNPYFWPKIWQINSGITNPHEIRPGDPLVFVEGDMQAAPQLTQGEAAPGEEPVDEMPPEEELLAEIPELPVEQEQRPPLLEVPPSLAPWHLTTKKVDDFEANLISRVASQVPNVMRLTSYVVEQEPAEAGKIIEIEMGTDTANLYQSVFVESNEIGVGDNLVSYEVKNKLKNKKGETIGFSIELHGTLKVTEAVSTDKPVFKAMVTYLANPIRKDSFVKKGAYPIKTININAPTVAIETEIIGGEYDAARRILGAGSIVYLSSGSDSGLQEGNALQIYKNQKVRNRKTLVENNTYVIGKLQIVDVQPTRSTAVVVSSIDTITVGDITGAAAILSYDATQENSPEPTSDEVDEIEEEIELLEE